MEEKSQRIVKRVAEHQINKDDDPEGDGLGVDDTEPGTFQKAPPEVLKQRK